VTRRDRLRRVVLLCVHFSRNLAYYRAGHDRLTNASPSFWITIDGNFLDMAVMEWCKLFGDQKGRHSWVKVVTDPSRFEAELLSNLDRARAAVNFYHHYIVQREATAPDLDGLPTDLAVYYDHCFAEATSIYGRCGS